MSVGRTDKALCPVSAVLAYMAVRGPGPGPLFQFQDGRFLTRARLVMEEAQREWTAHRTRGTASGAAQQLQLPGRGLQRRRPKS